MTSDNPEKSSGAAGGRTPDELMSQVRFLEAEVTDLRRRVNDAPTGSRGLELRLADAQRSLAAVTSQNERLAQTLREARDQIMKLKEEVDRLAQPPAGFGTFLSRNDDDSIDVFTGGRKLRVNVSPSVDLDHLFRGQEVMLNEALNVVAALDYEQVGEVVMFKELLADGDRALVIASADEERVVRLAEPLRNDTIRAGDSLLLDTRAGYVYEKVPEVGGRGARPRRGPGHRLLVDRRPQGTRSRRSRTPSSCPTSTPSCSRSTSCARRRACCSTARPAAARR